MRATNQRQTSRPNNNAPLLRWLPTNRLKRALIVLLAVVALAVPVWLVSAAATNVWRKPRTFAPPSLSHANTKRNLSPALVAGAIYVDHSWTGTTPGTDPDGAGPATNFGVDSFATIQDGVNAAPSGGTVIVASGNYAEQVTISKSLTLSGAGTATTNINTPATLNPGIGGNLVLVTIDSAAVVDMSGISVQGPRVFTGCSSQIFYGVYAAGGANLNLHDAAVKDIRLQDPSLFGCQDGIAIRAGSQALAQTATLLVNNVTVTGYQKGGIVIDGAGTSGTVQNSTITGAGPANTAQNAIQIGRSASGSVSGNTISGSECSASVCGPDPLTQSSGTGLLVFQTSGPVSISNNTISNNDAGIYNNAPGTIINGNTMVGNRFQGIFQDEGSSTITGNTLTGTMNVGVAAVSFNGNTGDSTATLTGNTIVGATTGLQLLDETNADAFGPQLTAHFNRIVSVTNSIGDSHATTSLSSAAPASLNSKDGSVSSAHAAIMQAADAIEGKSAEGKSFAWKPAGSAPVPSFPPVASSDLKDNWWGCNAGPGNPGCGSVSGSNVDFNPWFVVSAQAVPNSMTPGGTSNISVDLTHTSDNVVPGSTPPDTPVSYDATPNGTMTPATGTITAGAASSQFTSTTPSSAAVTVTVDNENLNLPITVTVPSFSINNVTQNEGNAGTTNFIFTVTKTGGTGLPSSVQFQTADGTATTADNDYVAQSGTLNFGPADTAMQITVAVNGDTTIEPNETFTVHLTAPSGATISNADGTGTITNDDRVPANVVYVDDSWVGTTPGTDPDGAGPATEFGYDAFATIQDGVNAVAAGGTVNVAAGTYTENVTIPKALTLTGAGAANVFLLPALSAPNTCAGASLCPGGSNLILVQASNVTISGLTLDGDNPNLTSGVNSAGADVDARNGIITNHAIGVFNNLEVHHTTVKNIYLRGIYASSGGTFNFHDNTVQNVQADPGSIGMFNFAGSGAFTNNNVSDSSDAISSNHSTGTTYTGNTITNSESGIHSDNAGDGGGTPDVISGNTVTNSSAFGYGIWVFVPYKTVTVQNNTVTNVDLGLAVFGDSGVTTTTAPTMNVRKVRDTKTGKAAPKSVNISEPDAAIQSRLVAGRALEASPATPAVAPFSASFTGNTVDGQNKANSVGAFFSTNELGFGSSNPKVSATGNTIINNGDGFYLEAEDGFTLETAISFNRIVNDTNSGATQATGTGFGGTVNGSMENNWWGCNAGPNNTGCGNVVGAGIDFNPWIVLGINASPNSITPGGSSTITADMTHNSDAALPAGGPIPGVGVAFGASQGTVLPTSGTITGGQATTTFTSTSATNGSASATVDNQTVNAPITVTAPAFSIDDVTHLEGNPPGTTAYVFTVTRSGPTALSSSVQFQTMDGTATVADNDYAATSGTLSFGPSDTTMQITVQVNHDFKVELDETFTVHLFGEVGATISDADGTGTIQNDDTAPSVVYVDDDFTGPIGSDPDGAGPATAIGYDAFATIQEGVNAVAAGGTVNVAAGNYKENPNVNKALTLRGANVGVAGSAARAAEANVITNGNQTAVFTVTSSNVTIDGFTIDGDDPLVTGAALASGDDTNVSYGVRPTGAINNLTVQNNIVKRVFVGLRGDTNPSQGNVISNNWFDSIGNFDFGYCVSIRNNFYANVTNNKMTRAWTGIHINNHNGAGGPASFNITGNEIHSYAGGILYWLQFNGATGATISNNQMTAETGAVANNFGVLMVSIQNAVNPTFTSNTIAGHNYGIGLFNVPTTSTITLGATNSVSNSSLAGIFLTDNLNFNPVGTTNFLAGGPGAASTVNVSGLSISGNTGDGVKVEGGTNAQTLNVNGSTIAGTSGTKGVELVSAHSFINLTASTVTGFATGVALQNSAGATAHFNRIISGTAAIDNPNNQTVNLENNWWGCNAGPGNTGCGTVTGAGADFNPWIVLGVSASPASISPGGTANVTADMTHDSSAGTPVGVTTLPLPNAAFTATHGTMLPTANGFTSGQSQSTFTSSDSSSSSACAMVDNEQQCTPITVTLPSFSIDDVTMAEGNTGTTSFTFTVTKTGLGAASVDYATVNGTATAPSDYTAIAPATLSFLSGDASKQVTVLVNGDTTFEANETFTVHLSNAINGTISDADGLGTITNDDTCGAFSTVYVNQSWAGTALGDDPDGPGPATSFGCDSFAAIQEGVNAVSVGGTVIISAGTYNEDVNANKAGVSLLGAGAGLVSVVGPIGGPGSTITIAASNITVAGMTITRAGNNTTDWNNPNLNSAGISIQGQAITGAVIRDNVLTGNRTGIDINNSNGHTVRNNSITDNRSGMVLRNQTDNLTVVENFITNNWTLGVVFLDASGGTNSPLQTAHHSNFNNNDLSGNWYGQIVDRQTGGALPAPGTTNLKNFTGDWFGTASPVTTTANSTEPGYAAQIPVEFGGSATAPGGQPDIAGPASANFKTDPVLTVGTDTNVETTPGRGTNGFQGVAINQTIVVEPSSLHGWVDFDDDPGVGTGSGGFEDGPGTAPLGAGSYFLRVDANGRHAVGTTAYIGTRMDDITELKYWSYQNNNTNAVAAISLQFDIDYDLNDNDNTYMGRLVFEPYITSTNTVQQGVWQNWDALAGKWWGTRSTVTVGGVAGVAQPCQQATPCTWAQVLSLFPNAGVGNTPARALLFKAGGPVGPGGFDGNVDDFSIKINTAAKTYDFEPNPHLSINDVSHNEGNAGTTSYDFTVTLSRPSSSTVTVDYATANGTAIAPGDFTAIGTTQLTFNPGETSKTVSVQVNGDLINESDEQFFVNLSNPSVNADITDNQGVGTIVNDDAQPSFSIDDVTHNEGNTGTTNFTFTVTRTGATELPSSVQFQTVDGTATVADNDYVSQSGTLNFGPADTTMQITVLVNGDTTVEPNEAFTVHLSAPSGATISDADGTATITNDDRTPPNVVYVDDNWIGTTPGTDPDGGAGPATEFGYDAFATIHEGVNAVAAGGTVNVYAGNYPENVNIPKSLSLLGPNATVDPNTGTRVAEAVVRPAATETSLQGSTSGTIFRLGTGSGHINVTLNGFTLDGNNPSLTNGRTLNGVEVHTGAAIVNSTGSFDTNPGAFDTTMIVQNNIIQNLERYGVLVDNAPARTPSAGNDVSHNKIDNLPSGNNFGGDRGRGIAFEENVYGSATFNVMTRVNVGWQDDNYNLASPAAGTLIDHNEIHTYHRGIFHNLQYQDATAATITNNQLFAETTGDFPASTTNFGLELASIQSAVGATVTNNNSTGNVYGVLIWNVPTTNTITVSGGTLTGNQYGVMAALNDPQFGAGAAGHAVISGVTASGATVAGMVADGAGASMEVTGSTITACAKGVVIRNGAVGNKITGNSIHDNTGLGIDLGDDGVTANDPSDTDSGANNLQNFPVVTTALAGTPNTIAGTLNSTPGQTFTIDVYANPVCDPSGNGEGQTLIGSTTATTNGSGDAAWTLNPGSLTAGDFITATATDSAGNTSEFSACFQARAFIPGTITFNQVSTSETNSNHDVNITVSRTGGSDGDVSVQYNVTDGTATVADNDYSAAPPSGTLTWLNGDASDRLITINVKGDPKFEADETVLLTLSNPTGGASTGGTNPALTITNDDTAPSFSIDDVTHNEGDSGTTAYVFTITKTGNTGLNAGVNFQTADGSATVAGNDYQSQTGSLTFLPADTTKTVTVLVNGDTTVEPDETFSVNLSSPTNATISDSQGIGTITNDDTGVSVAVSPASVLEDGATNLVYTFTRNGNTAGALTVNFTVAGTATFNSDYTQSGAATFSATTGSVTFAAGSSTATVTVDPTADTTVEPDETVILTVASGTGYNVATPSAATGTITNDDTDVTLSVSPAAVLEDGATNLVYTFTRNGNTTGALTANFSVGGTATFNSDYTQSGAATFGPTGGTVTFAAGSSTATVTIDPTADTTVEPDETVILTVTSGTGYSAGTPGAATGTITNDDTDVSVAVSPASVLEDGATNLVYTFTRNGNTSGALAVNFSVGGSATFGTDYTQSGAAAFTAASGSVTFAAGSSTATVTVDPTADTTVEPDETVILTVASGTGYNVATPTAATGTILNDDTDVSVAVSPASVLEDGAANLLYTFTRNGNTTGALTANFSVAGTATFNSDYTQSGAATFTATSGTVTFAAGSSTATVTVDPTADTTVEPDETVILTVTSGTGYGVGTPVAATGTILNDDTDVSVAVSPSSVLEDGAANLVYTFTRNGNTTGALTANFSVAGTATFNSDYTQSGAATFSATSGTVTFTAGSSTATVTVDPTADTTVEPDETVILTVTSGTGYGVGTPGAATGTITNDDTDVSVAVSPASVLEDGATNLVYTFTRNGNTTGALTANFSVAGTATFNSDYTQSGAATFSATNGTVTFAAGSSTATVTVDPTADTTVEPDETVILTVTSGTGYGVGTPGAATGTITNDDTDVSVAVSPSSVPEDGAANLVYTFTRNGITTGALTANFSVAGTATFNSDYTQSGAATFTATSGTVTFAAGSSTATVTVDPTPDTTVEPDETVILTVTSGTGYGVGTPGAATGTIANDDGNTGGTLQFSSASYSTTESSFFTIITVQRQGDTTGAVSVDYATPDDSAATSVVPCETVTGIASPRCDFTAAVGTLHWEAGDNSPKSFIILISQDDYVEGPEGLTLTLSNPTGGAQLGSQSTAVLTINDDANEGTQNPIDDPTDFVRQQYHDFLNREPDQSGFDFWVGNFPPCGGDPQCIEVKRINVSAAFYLSIEFQGTGYFVERLYKSAYGDATGTSTDGGPHQVAVPIMKFSEFLPDTQEIGRGVVVLAPGWEAALEANKVAFTEEFVQRPRFLNAYPLSMTPAQFVDALNANAGNALSPAERDQLVSDLTGGVKTRAQVLRAVADDQDLINSEFNRGFVLMQYYGFLRRNPNAAPDIDYSGYDFWLKKLNSFNGDFVQAEMVKAFLSSLEYRDRAGAQ